MDRELQFINELNRIESGVEFLKHFKNDKKLNEILFTEYLGTKLKPDLDIFISHHISDEEINLGFSRAATDPENEYPIEIITNEQGETFRHRSTYSKIEIYLKDLERNFNYLNERERRNDMPDKYLAHSIDRVEFINKISRIVKNLILFPEEKANSKKGSRAFIKNNITELENLKLPNLTRYILTDFLNEQCKIINDDYDFIEAPSKTFAIEYINKYLNKLDKNTDYTPTSDYVLFKEKILNSDNILLPKVNIKEVFEFFKVLTEEPKDKEDFYLSERKLLIFINNTFIETEKEFTKQKFNIPLTNKIDVRSVFRRFQDYCSEFEYNQKRVKQKYFDIMDNSFEGFNQTDRKKWNDTNSNIATITNKKV